MKSRSYGAARHELTNTGIFQIHFHTSKPVIRKTMLLSVVIPKLQPPIYRDRYKKLGWSLGLSAGEVSLGDPKQ